MLLRYRLPFYLPLVPKDNFIRGKPVRSSIPLFAGYVFLFGSEDERVRALTTNRVSRVLAVDDQDQLHRDLRQIHRLIESNAPLTTERRLAAGQRVRVKAGAMAGLEGTVVSRRGGHRLLIAVHFLQQGASVAIDDFKLEPLD
jgi:transcriptional antiterminator RfaH